MLNMMNMMNMMNITIERSNRKHKKYVAKIYKPGAYGKPKKIHFGDNRYQDYTMHKDPKRKELYLLRHSNDPINDIYTPAFWAINLLWNKPTLKGSAKDIKKRYGNMMNIKNIKILII
jgi:hypothetical protein